MKTVLVAGGAGYIGSHIVAELASCGLSVVSVDNFSTGLPERVKGIPNLDVNIVGPGSVESLVDFMAENQVESVIHLAAKKSVVESVSHPALYYRQNVGGLINVLRAMQISGVTNLVFSSTAAVYGDCHGHVHEDHPTNPLSPYGDSKLMCEQVVDVATQSGSTRAVSLRYFNVAGAGNALLSDRGVTNLIPMVFERLSRGEAPRVFGNDYETPDGTCIRDFIHVSDLARAHILALEFLAKPLNVNHTIFNIGTGTGTSVSEILSVVRDVTGLDIEPVVEPPRPGDPAVVVASPQRAIERLNWAPVHSIREMVASAWSAYRGN